MEKPAGAKRLRIFFAGVGGQGTLTASRLLAQTALDAGVEAIGGEVHGMAQRGGVVESALLLGGWRSPRLDLGEADVLLGFEPLETLRALAYLRPGGAVFSSSDALAPLAVALGKASYPELEKIQAEVGKVASQCHFFPCRELGQKAGAVQSGNTVLLGALCASGLLAFGPDALKAAIGKYLPQKIQESNLRAVDLGVQALASAQ